MTPHHTLKEDVNNNNNNNRHKKHSQILIRLKMSIVKKNTTFGRWYLFALFVFFLASNYSKIIVRFLHLSKLTHQHHHNKLKETQNIKMNTHHCLKIFRILFFILFGIRNFVCSIFSGHIRRFTFDQRNSYKCLWCRLATATNYFGPQNVDRRR